MSFPINMPGISVLNPCFLEAFGHHLVALDLACQDIETRAGISSEIMAELLLDSAVKRYSEMTPEELQLLTQRFLGYAQKIAQQQQ